MADLGEGARGTLGAEPPGDVARGGGGAGHAPRRVPDRRDGQAHVDPAAALGEARRLEVADALPVVQPDQDAGQLVAALRRHDQGDGAADRLLGAVAVEALRGRVPADDAALEGAADDRVLGRLDDRGEQGLHRLGLPALADVAGHREPAHHLAAAHDTGAGHLHRGAPAVASHHLALELGRDLAPGAHRLQPLAHQHRAGAVQHREHRAADQLVGAEAGELLAVGVHHRERAIQIEQEERLGHALRDQAIALLGVAQRAKQPLAGQRPIDGGQELRGVHRLHQVRGGVARHRGEGAVEGSVPGQQDDLGVGRARLDAPEQVEPRDVGEPAVDDRQIHRASPTDAFQRILSAVHRVDVMAALAEHLAHRLPDDRVVVDDEDIGAGGHGPVGVHGKCHPRPARDTQKISYLR